MGPEKAHLISFRYRDRTALALLLVVTSFGLSCLSVTMAATEGEVGHLRMRIIDLEDKITNLYNFTVCRLSELEKRLSEMQIEINNCKETVCQSQDINKYQSEDDATTISTTCSLANTEFNVNDCAVNDPCLNGGTCIDGISNYTCACADEFFGVHCEDAPEYDEYSVVVEGHISTEKSKPDISTSTSAPSDTFATKTKPESTASDAFATRTDPKFTTSGTSTVETDTESTASEASTTETVARSADSDTSTTEKVPESTVSGTTTTETYPESTTSDTSTTETVLTDSTTRKFKSSNASLIISVGGGIQQVSLDEFQITQVIQNESQAVVFDVNIRTRTLFWFCYKDRKIYKGPIHLRDPREALTEAQVIMHDLESLVLAISIDWIYNNIYWTDSRGGKIFVSNYDGTMKKFLINDGLSFPAFIVVNPLNGWMHWTDVNKNQIERAGMDGSRREVIVSSNIKSPLGLTLDLVKNRLYWTNYINPSSISSSNFDGSEIKLIFKPNGPEFAHSHFQSITTMEDFVFWTDTTYKKVYKVNKVNGEGLSTVYTYDTDVYDVKVNHVSKQPEGENRCEKRSKKCSHFCFPVPGKKRPSGGGDALVSTSCACPDNLVLSGDKRHCFYDLLGWHRSVFSQ